MNGRMERTVSFPDKLRFLLWKIASRDNNLVTK